MESIPASDVERKPCGCTIRTFPNGRKTFAPCIPCGLLQAGHALMKAGNWWGRKRALRMAGGALAAVATTINNAATQANAVASAVNSIAKGDGDEAE